MPKLYLVVHHVLSRECRCGFECLEPPGVHTRSKSVRSLTGTAEQVAQAAKGYRVYYAKHPEAGGEYSMDHSSVIYVMDPEGRFTANFTHESTPEQISERLKKLIG